MRFVPLYSLTEKSVLAKPIIGFGGQVLLATGVRMTKKYIKRLKGLGLTGAYVDDPLSEDIEIADAISEELRKDAVRLITSIYTSPGDNYMDELNNARQVAKMAEHIVEEIITQKDTVINLIDLKTYDTYTFYHCVNTAVLCVVMGLGMELPRDQLVDIAYASLLHDIGKVFIDSAIINKPAKLTAEEYEIVKTHSMEGYKYIKEKYYCTEKVARGVIDHHEKIDGTGYPNNKKGHKISLSGRMISVADVYDALTSDRSYRRGVFPAEAVEYIQSGAGSSFDFDVVTIFTKKVAPFPVGTCVLLSNDTAGIVVENHEGFLTRPLVRIFKSEGLVITPYDLDLSQDAYDVTIVEALKI